MTETVLSRTRPSATVQRYLRLTKPRVVSLIIFCAAIGMLLATDGMVPLVVLVAAIFGITLAAGAAAALNCLVEQKIDALMARTRGRPLPRGEVGSIEALLFLVVTACVGLGVLYYFVNPLTMWLTLATFVGYTIIYTIVLKPLTPQNIVIGGASGAMPPVLGWAAMTGEAPYQAWLLFLVIFLWTPPHFWSLALYRTHEYARTGLPMLPVVKGREYTLNSILAYTIVLGLVATLPYFIGMSGWVYLVSAAVLSVLFVVKAWRMKLSYSDAAARRTFRYSISYLSLLFAALLVDHYLPY
ncbi:MAG: protoheme IX farnesyltransferase [Proteobacteria bacterium]|nr:MAG: protoheme IX farnesyltransferase [Pseudomonadota bacterium]QKK10304.1 MAG: protoheme IX farnesyltransferase [Pseudomonadota bacterium]